MMRNVWVSSPTCVLLLFLTSEWAVPHAGTSVSTSPQAGAAEKIIETRTGEARYYGDVLKGQKTASGELFDNEGLVAAHRSYPFGTRVRVTNLENKRSVEVRIVDRPSTKGAAATRSLIDVSRKAAEGLGFIEQGRARVRLDVLEWGAKSKAM